MSQVRIFVPTCNSKFLISIYCDIRRKVILEHCERQVTITLFIVVVVFILCQSCRIVTNVAGAMLLPKYQAE